MVIVLFPSTEMRRRALAYLLGRFPGKSWATGEVMVPEPALTHLAAEGIAFTVEGRARYDQIADLRKRRRKPSKVKAAAAPRTTLQKNFVLRRKASKAKAAAAA